MSGKNHSEIFPSTITMRRFGIWEQVKGIESPRAMIGKALLNFWRAIRD